MANSPAFKAGMALGGMANHFYNISKQLVPHNPPQASPGFGSQFVDNLRNAPMAVFGPGSPTANAVQGVVNSAPGQFVQGTGQAFGQGVGQIYNAGDELGNAITGVGTSGESLSPERRVYQAGGAIADTGQGAMGALFSPAAGLGQAVPAIGAVNNAVGQGLNTVSSGLSGVTKNLAGVPEGSEQAQVLDKLHSTATNAAALLITSKLMDLLRKPKAAPINKNMSTEGLNFTPNSRPISSMPENSTNSMSANDQAVLSKAAEQGLSYPSADQIKAYATKQLGYEPDWISADGWAVDTGGHGHSSMSFHNMTAQEIVDAAKTTPDVKTPNIYKVEGNPDSGYVGKRNIVMSAPSKK